MAATAKRTSKAELAKRGRTTPYLSVAERVECGKAARAEVPRSSHAVYEAASDRPDPSRCSSVRPSWLGIKDGIDGRPHDYYIRQLKDWKASAEIEQMVPTGMAAYGRMCGWTLARAHARSGDRIALAAYLGKSDRFDRAILAFSKDYAEQNDLDYRSLEAAVKSGRIAAHTGL
jgi:hypothetical protein